MVFPQPWCNVLIRHTGQTTVISFLRSELLKLLSEAESLETSILKLKTMDWPILSHDAMSLEVLTATLRSQVDDRKGKVYVLVLYSKY